MRGGFASISVPSWFVIFKIGCGSARLPLFAKTAYAPAISSTLTSEVPSARDGTAFSRLACAAALSPLLQGALTAATWPERERHLAAAYEHAAALHNALGISVRFPRVVRSLRASLQQWSDSLGDEYPIRSPKMAPEIERTDH